MSKRLIEFLMETPVSDMTKKVKIKTHVGEHEFTIRPLTGAEFNAIQEEAVTQDGKGRTRINMSKLIVGVILSGCVDPDFKDAQTIKAAGVMSPAELIGKVLTAGTQAKLRDEIMVLSDLAGDINEDIEEAKN